jgi:putative membrane protein
MAHVVPGPAAPPPLGPEGFDWTVWHADPALVTGLVLLGGIYVAATVRRRRLDPTARPEPLRIACFLGGVLVMFGALSGPLHDLSDYYLFSAHMVQHLLLAFAVPPLVLYGTPGWLIAPLVRLALVRRVGRVLTRPSGAFAAFNLILVAWHLPPLYNLAMVEHPIHIVQHLMFLVVSVLLWWPVLSPARELPRAPYPVQLLYLFVVGLPMVLVSIFITMADTVLYPFYAAAPRVWEPLTPHADQHLGGLIMWIPGGLVFLLAISVVFFRWQATGGDDVALEPPEASPVEAPHAC